MHKVIKDYVCFDLETTGFGKTAEIIEIGAIKVRDGTTVDKFSELVKPTNRISGVVTALTGISQNDLALGTSRKFFRTSLNLSEMIFCSDTTLLRSISRLFGAT